MNLTMMAMSELSKKRIGGRDKFLNRAHSTLMRLITSSILVDVKNTAESLDKILDVVE